MQGGASPMIEVSRGPSEDRRHFYSTSYSHFHGIRFPNAPRGAGYIIAKQETGYTKNVTPFVHYNKKVDESEHYRVESPFVTDNKATFKAPSLSNPLAQNDKVGVLRESGFTLMPLRLKPNFKGFEPTIMTSSFSDSTLKLKPSAINKSIIIPSASAFTNDVGHMSSFGSAALEEKRVKPQKTENVRKIGWKDIKVIKMVPDGYTRSTFQDYLKTSDPSNDYVAKSTFKGTIEPSLYREQRSGPIKLGFKEPTGDVKNNDKPHTVKDRDSNSRFISVTKESFQVRKNDKNAIISDVKRSGYSLNYAFKVPKKLPEEFEDLHPTLVKYTLQKERGIRTVPPTLV